MDSSKIKTDSCKIHPEVFSLTELLKSIIREYEQEVRAKKLKLILKIDDGVNVTADKHSVEQIIESLLKNAVELTLDGSIEITCSKFENHFTSVKICDTGGGVPGDYLDRIIEPLGQNVTSDIKNTGIGVSLTKARCEVDNVEIDLHSKMGTGTIVTLYFNS